MDGPLGTISKTFFFALGFLQINALFQLEKEENCNSVDVLFNNMKTQQYNNIIF